MNLRILYIWELGLSGFSEFPALMTHGNPRNQTLACGFRCNCRHRKRAPPLALDSTFPGNDQDLIDSPFQYLKCNGRDIQIICTKRMDNHCQSLVFLGMRGYYAT